MQYLLLLLGVFACSTAVILINLSKIDPVTLTMLRLAGAAIVLLPLFVRDWRRHAAVMTARHVWDATIPGIVFAIHLVSWVIGARTAPASNASLIVNLAPVAMPFFLAAVAAERITRRELLATLIAFAGMLILSSADFQLNATHFRGDVICFGSMLLFACYLALGRKYRHHPTVWLYVVPLYAAGAVTAGIAMLFLADLSPVDWNREVPLVAAMVLIPTVVGHSLLNNAMRSLRGQVVTVVNMMQFVFASLMAYPVLHQLPHWAFYPASAAVVAAGILATRKTKA